MKTKNKIVLAALVIAAFLVVISLISINNIKSAQKGSESSPLPTVTSTGLVTTTASAGQTATQTSNKSTVPNDTSNIYQNKDYKFSLTFTDAWRGYEVVKSQTIPQGAEAGYDVLLSTSDRNYKAAKGGKAVPLSIYVYKEASWEQNKNSARSTEISRGDGYVFTYSIWEETPADLRSITEKEIINVIKTFKYLG